jgi:hypothetical protein
VYLKFRVHGKLSQLWLRARPCDNMSIRVQQAVNGVLEARASRTRRRVSWNGEGLDIYAYNLVELVHLCVLRERITGGDLG